MTREDSEAESRATPWFSPKKYKVTPVNPPSARTGRSAALTRRLAPAIRAMTGRTAQATTNRATAMVMGGISTSATLMLRNERPQSTDSRRP